MAEVGIAQSARMKKVLLLLPVILSTSLTFGQYKPIEKSSSLKFNIRNLGFNVPGTFTGFHGFINFDPKNIAQAGFDVSVDAATVNTASVKRDDHLREPDYFGVKQYPRIRLSSEKIIASSMAGTYSFTGKLFIKGKSQQITFPFIAVPTADGFRFKGSFKINRRDFGVGGFSTLSSELEVLLDVMAEKS